MGIVGMVYLSSWIWAKAIAVAEKFVHTAKSRPELTRCQLSSVANYTRTAELGHNERIPYKSFPNLEAFDYHP